ncbi:T-complex protein 1 gamma subunit [Perkinsela sp. CCAP 1560/4]|nr:T-complex protein 1 gamma subunit [Perkinsela sp. CCAP 1560/4]|eukprot:KNH09647.1 T-complex protein 1 gamma subunit [Perkinsela sp. CCAP 1560/4]
MGGIVLTNDGNSILREIDVVHPSAKQMMELSRILDEEVGDGTTSVVILAGELLTLAEPLLEKSVHPLDIIRGYNMALKDALECMNKGPLSHVLDTNNEDELNQVVKACLGTKISSKHYDTLRPMVIQAVKSVQQNTKEDGDHHIDIKRFVKIEKIPGGSFSESELLSGVMLNKDLVHPRMRRHIRDPRVLLLDTPLEYKKPETSFNMEVQNDDDFEKLILMEEEYVREMCKTIISFKPDIVVTEKGVSDLAAHFFHKANISVIRRVRKTDNIRIGRATGARINSSADEIKEDSIGVKCGLFELRKIGDEYFSYFVECKDNKACSIVLRGASKDALNEVERNLRDALCVARNVLFNPRVAYGGGSLEIELSQRLYEKSLSIEGVQQLAYKNVATALEVIPRTLAQNCGASVARILTELRAKHHAADGVYWGLDGLNGSVVDVSTLQIIEPLEVKCQILKTAIEAACTMLRIDDIISGVKAQSDQSTSKNTNEDE